VHPRQRLRTIPTSPWSNVEHHYHAPMNADAGHGRIDQVPITVTEAVDILRHHGYTEDFELVGDQLKGSGGNAPCAIRLAVVEHVYRFEGPSDPGDLMIVFGLLDPAADIRGTLAAPFGPMADPTLYDHLSDLSTRLNWQAGPPQEQSTQ
jgi:hypothetical protein